MPAQVSEQGRKPSPGSQSVMLQKGPRKPDMQNPGCRLSAASGPLKSKDTPFKSEGAPVRLTTQAVAPMAALPSGRYPSHGNPTGEACATASKPRDCKISTESACARRGGRESVKWKVRAGPCRSNRRCHVGRVPHGAHIILGAKFSVRRTVQDNVPSLTSSKLRHFDRWFLISTRT